ncbi:hypothetical protein DLE60_12170 [Micromonospora globispora]|uniref:hypothetical protein n=1 Tax=Micromonospora globispora TaxID=1450148 RepID=UPI000D6F9810|nr:hypothetical protein [Micromonospora globispora]PWU60236.1 hypothetical protein DLE60_12170 [Micromonospora globispora]RQX02852.1 hypothetical protein DKL51_04460 [Micromonospora globispora]
MRRLPLLTSVAAIGLVALLVAALLHTRRENEWAHGGDAVAVDVVYRVAGKDDATEAARALGWPVGPFDGQLGVLGDQALVVRGGR